MFKWIAVLTAVAFVGCGVPETEEVETASASTGHSSVITDWDKPFGAFGIELDDVPDPAFQQARKDWEEIKDTIPPHFLYGMPNSLWYEAMVNPVEIKSLWVGTGVSRSQWEQTIREKVLMWMAPLEGMPTKCPVDAYGQCTLPGGAIPTQVSMSGGRLQIYVFPQTGRSYYYWHWTRTWRWWPPGWETTWTYKIHLYQGPTYDVWDGHVMLHELGHAFGLKDTYIEGVWTCQAGQPDSVMCRTQPTLQPDDIQAIRYAYCYNTKRCNPSAYAF